MPALVALAIRSIIQMAVTLGIIQFVQSYLIPLLNNAIVSVSEKFGATAEEAQDIVANEYLQFAENVGIGVLVLRAKTPTVIAEKLGFTSKGWVKRPLKPATTAKIAGASTAVVSAEVATTAEVQQASTQIAKARGITFQQVNDVTSFIMKIVGFPFVIIYTVAQVIDFGNWNSGAYQHVLQKVIAVATFGLLVPDPKVPQSNVLSKDVWDKVYNVYKENGATQIHDPYKNTTVPFSRQNMIDLVDKLAAQMLADGHTAGLKQILAATTALIDIKDIQTTSTPTPTKTIPQTTPTVQVFTGIVSQGVLGNGTVFTPRSNDMIDDVAELIDSCSINLASFLSSLPSRVSYEIKIVASITDKNGFTQRGSTTQVQSGTYSNGQPKYKTVTNKFAVLYLYLLTDKATRTKIATVNVGPVNSVNFQPNSNDLNAVAGRLQSIVTTSDTKAIQTLVTTAPVAVTPTAPVLTPLPNYNTSAKNEGDLGYAFYKRPADNSNPAHYTAVPDYKFYDPTYSRITEEEYRRATGDTGDYTNSGYSLVNGVFTQYKLIPVVTTYGKSGTGSATTAPPAQRLGANALTLNEWYIANGQLLPTIQARSLLYEKYGLGASALYIGSAEQNIRLLEKLKSA